MGEVVRLTQVHRERRIGVRFAEGEIVRLEDFAQRRGVTVSGLIRMATSDFLDRENRWQPVDDDLGVILANIVGTIRNPKG